MSFKIGDVKKFLSPKVGFYEIKDIVENPGVSIDYEFDGGICPDCKKKCKVNKHYKFKKIYVLEDNDGNIGYKGETSDGELVRMPDTTFNPQKVEDVDKIMKEKSQYLKEKSDGN